MNRFSYTKYLFILTVLVTGFLYALPNIFPTQPAIQIAYTDSGKSADQTLKNEIDEIILNNSCLLYTSPSPRDGLLSRMPSSA